VSASTVFVTGVAGFLGGHLAERFLQQGHRVAGCDNLLGGYRDNVPEGAEFHQTDCLDLERLTAAMKGADTVYHCAATAYEGLSVFSPFIVTQNIVDASVATFTAAIRNRVRRIVFCSSMARYGTNEVPFREEMPPRPQDPYGIGKVAAETYLRNLCGVHGVEWVICVPHNIYGPRQKYDDPFRNVAAIMINLMLQGRQPIIYGNGTQRRCFSFIEDDLPVLTRLAFAEDVVGEVINIGPDEEFVAGVRPVEEAFVARRHAVRLLVAPGRRSALERLVLHATTLRIPIVEVEGGSLTSLAGFDGHQGIALVVEPRRFATPDEVLARAIERGEPPFILVLDSLEDPQNLGTVLRSAEAAGVHGVLFPTERQAPLSPAAVKASAGATEHLLLCPVDDLAGAMTDLHVRGVRVVGSDSEAPLTARQADLRGPPHKMPPSARRGRAPACSRLSACRRTPRPPSAG